MLPKAFIASRPSGLPNSVLLARKRDGRPERHPQHDRIEQPVRVVEHEHQRLADRNPLVAVDGAHRIVEAHQRLPQPADQSLEQAPHAGMIRCLGASKMRSTMRRRWAFFLLAAGGSRPPPPPGARAAELTVDAPALRASIRRRWPTRSSDLIGRPLAEVADVDFRVRIAETSPGKWRLHLETIDGKGSAGRAAAVRGSREIDGATCAELAEAASVAIAVSVRSMEAAGSAPVPPAPAPGPPTHRPRLPTRAPAGGRRELPGEAVLAPAR